MEAARILSHEVSDRLEIPADYAAKRCLEFHVEATELVAVPSGSAGREIRLTSGTAAAWMRMRDAASREGIVLLAISGFRSIERQSEIIHRKVLAGETLDAVLRTIAAPGYSEHHTGRAIDMGVPDEPPLTQDFALTPAFRWLKGHADEFGFKLSYPRDNAQGFIYEPWHWCLQVAS
jgi:D-alanyl-D-alanine carboxypeptidase